MELQEKAGLVLAASGNPCIKNLISSKSPSRFHFIFFAFVFFINKPKYKSQTRNLVLGISNPFDKWIVLIMKVIIKIPLISILIF